MGFDGGVIGALEDVEDIDSVREVFEVGVEGILELGDGGGVVDGVGWRTGFEMVLEGELGSGRTGGVEFCGAKVHEAAREEGRGGGVVRMLLGSGSCPTADAVCDAHGVVADKVGIFADLNGEGGMWVSGGGWGVEGAAVLGDPVCSDIELVLQSLSFRGPWCIRGGRWERGSSLRRNRVEIGRERRVGWEEGRMDGLGEGQLRMLRLFRGFAR